MGQKMCRLLGKDFIFALHAVTYTRQPYLSWLTALTMLRTLSSCDSGMRIEKSSMWRRFSQGTYMHKNHTPRIRAGSE
jgi:hypothetical protein